LQHAIERVKRPGGSQEALDRKKEESDCGVAGKIYNWTTEKTESLGAL